MNMTKPDPMWGGNWCQSADETQFHRSDPDDLSRPASTKRSMSTENAENEPPVGAGAATCRGIDGAPQIRLPLLESPNKRFEANTKNDAAAENLSNIADDFIKLHLFGTSMTKPLDTNSKAGLLAMQTIFMGELSSLIPPEYVSGLLFSPNSKTLALIKSGQPIGGICFVSFPKQGFIEIVFVAIVSSEQFKGHGDRLMGHMKDYVLSKGLWHLLTHANDPASGFFRKQGFSTHIRLAGTIYEDRIRPSHNGATLMHCELHPKIVFSKFKSVLHKQRQVLMETIVQQENAVQDIRPGLTCFKEGTKSIPIASIPGLQEIGWQPNAKDKEEADADPRQLAAVLKSVRKHRSAWPFLSPVCASEVPDYYVHIKYPMDLQTMDERLERGYYRTRRLFIADMSRIFANCRIYNSPGTVYVHCASTLELYFHRQMRQNRLNS